MCDCNGAVLKGVQQVQWDILQEMDRVCRTGGIHYTVAEGTLLGAVRYGGFANWDNDACVAMLREEYESFRRACGTLLDRRFYLQDIRVTPGYCWGYGKLCCRDTLFARGQDQKLPFEQAVSVGILPLDGVPDSFALRALQKICCALVRERLLAGAGCFADESRARRALYAALRRIPRGLVCKAYQGLIRSGGRKRTRLVRLLLAPAGRKASFRGWYEKSIPMAFEGGILRGMLEYDEYLTAEYGDYMLLPPDSLPRARPVTAVRLPGDAR